MNDELKALLNEVRDLYVRRLTAVVAELATDGSEVLSERVLYDESGSVAEEGPFLLPMRVDAVVVGGEEAETVSIDSKQMLSFPPMLDTVSGVELEVRKFTWDAVRIRVEPASLTLDPLFGWFREHFAADKNGDGVLGVVHVMSDPAADGDALTFDVDLGTAPVDAFEALLDACRTAGAKRILVGG